MNQKEKKSWKNDKF